MNVTYKFAKLRSDINPSILTSGDLIFCEEDGSISLKTEDQLLNTKAIKHIDGDYDYILSNDQIGYDGANQILKIGDGVTKFSDIESPVFAGADLSIFTGDIVGSLTELDLSIYPLKSDLLDFDSKLEEFNTNQELRTKELDDYKDLKKEELNSHNSLLLTALDDRYTDDVNSLVELDLSMFPTVDLIEDFNSKLDNYNNAYDNTLSELEEARDSHKESLNDYHNLLKDSIDDKYSEDVSNLVELDLSMYPTMDTINDFNAKLEEFNDKQSEVVNTLDTLKDSKVEELTSYNDLLKEALDDKYSEDVNQLVELDLSMYPTMDTINDFNSKLDNFNNNYDSNITELDNLKEEHKSELASIVTTFSNNLNDEGYIKSSDLTELDISELVSIVNTLETKVADLESRISLLEGGE